MVYNFTCDLPDEYREKIANLMKKLNVKSRIELIKKLIDNFDKKIEKIEVKYPENIIKMAEEIIKSGKYGKAFKNPEELIEYLVLKEYQSIKS